MTEVPAGSDLAERLALLQQRSQASTAGSGRPHASSSGRAPKRGRSPAGASRVVAGGATAAAVLGLVLALDRTGGQSESSNVQPADAPAPATYTVEVASDSVAPQLVVFVDAEGSARLARLEPIEAPGDVVGATPGPLVASGVTAQSTSENTGTPAIVARQVTLDAPIPPSPAAQPAPQATTRGS